MVEKIQCKNVFYTPLYFLTSTEFFLPSQNSNFETKSQTLYKNNPKFRKFSINIKIKCTNKGVIKSAYEKGSSK